LSNAAGCDSIVTLNLTVNPTARYSYSQTICPGGTYRFGGRDLTTAETYSDTVPAQNGCDSIITLTLRVEYSSIIFDTLQICNAQLPYSYRDTIFDADAASGSYVFVDGCEKLTLELEIIKLPTVTVQAPQICADDPNFMLQIESVSNDYSHNFTDYSIIFDEKSLAAGFVNQTGEITDNIITVDMPDSVYPDHYRLTLSLSVADCNGQTLNVPFDVFYPDTVMKQKWYNVISLLNTYYNGGYEFSAYQWYKNGDIMIGENGSYIHLGENNHLQITDEYTVEITRPDGSKIFTCPFIPHEPKEAVSDYPVLAEPGIIKIFVSKENLKARIWTVTGKLLSKVDLTPPMQIVETPWQEAVYLIEIYNEEEFFKQVIPVIVKKSIR
jgi:hypothetical protein